MSLKLKILKELKGYKDGTTAWIVHNALGWDVDIVRTYMSHMKRERYVSSNGKRRCDKCGHPVNVYKITQKGLDRVKDFSWLEKPVSD